MLRHIYNQFVKPVRFPISKGDGVILALHEVISVAEMNTRLSRPKDLVITSEYLESLIDYLRGYKPAPFIDYLRGRKYEFISLDELHQRLVAGKKYKSNRKFVCITFDDGYRNNYEHAFPVLKKHKIPFAIYLISGCPDGSTLPSSIYLDEWIRNNDRIEFRLKGEYFYFEATTMASKARLLGEVDALLRKQLSNSDFKFFFEANGISTSGFGLSWSEVKELSEDPNVTIGAHTMTHPSLPKLASIEEVRAEILGSKTRIEEMIGKPVEHFSYPYGHAGNREFEVAKSCGFKTMTLASKGPVRYRKNHLDALHRRVVVYGNYRSMF
jgi:peptidoglycan/xylan/chitin deacetylase (PgdA/CDA1 family)